jgi:hypothetical protein
MTADHLDKLRNSIRAGFREEAAAELAGLQPAEDEATRLEGCFLKLLDFPSAEEMREHLALIANDSYPDPALRSRRLVYEGIAANRLQDPLTALAKLTDALDGARPLPDKSFTLDALLEMARVHSWLGNHERSVDCLIEVMSAADSATFDLYRFLTFCRLADLYAEVERWQHAKRTASFARTTAGSAFSGSIHWLQLLLCAARAHAALGEAAAAMECVDELTRRDATLPPYLQFRWRAAAIEMEIDQPDRTRAHALLGELYNLPGFNRTAGFQATIATFLKAKLDLKSGRLEEAITGLTQCCEWFQDMDLAIRLIDSKILLARAYAAADKKSRAVAELEGARNYCESRGLRLQLERVETASTELDLTFHPVEETNRVASKNAWRSRQAYVLMKRLGAGGQGTVYRAHDNARDRTVALKMLGNGGGYQGSEALQALSREVHAISKVVTPGIARIIACGKDEEGGLYVAQEFIEGDPLRKLIDEKSPARELIGIVAQVAQTLSALHAQRVVHADVKPENIMVKKDGNPVLVDFGIAVIMGDADKGSGMATAHYAPHDSAMLLRGLEYRDIFALGIVLLECLGAKVTRDDKARLLNAIWIEPALHGALRELREQEGIDLAAARRVIRSLLAPISLGGRGAGLPHLIHTMLR